jgi:hypothetical protein
MYIEDVAGDSLTVLESRKKSVILGYFTIWEREKIIITRV